jgi:CheY-like chemotaxis protein
MKSVPWPFDVMVSDVQLPGTGGVALLGAVRDRDLDIPVVLVTGAPDIASAAAAIEYGAFQYFNGGPPGLVLGVVAGVGFTMALFIAQLAFGDVQLLAAAKLRVILASVTAAVLALVLGRIFAKALCGRRVGADRR